MGWLGGIGWVRDLGVGLLGWAMVSANGIAERGLGLVFKIGKVLGVTDFGA